MKMTKILSLVMALLMVAACLVACPSNEQETTAPDGPSDVVHDITMWVSDTDGVREFMLEQVEAFKALHPEYKFNITVEKVGEGNAASQVLTDVATAPDIYCFAQDQINRLVEASALAPLGVQASQTVTENNDAGSVGAATVGDYIYAYPLTSDNGYFLFYDPSYITDEEAQTVEGIMAACERHTKKFAYNATNGWYTAAFFFSHPVNGSAPICSSTWTYSADGKTITGVEDNFNSQNGLIAMKGMRKITTAIDIFSDLDKGFHEDTIAAINGIWSADALEELFGEDIKATKLPTFTVDGQEYQMGSFSGYKLMGCKPQANNPAKAKLCADLALYLTSEEAQLERYYKFQWGPSNVNAQQNVDVMENKNLQALYLQQEFAQPQGSIPGAWWTEMTQLGTISGNPDYSTDEALLAALEAYEKKINEQVVK